jgi:hypothetical protein
VPCHVREGERVSCSGQLGAGQSDATGRCRGRFGLVSLMACAEGPQACLMARFQRLSRSPPSCPSYYGHGSIARESNGLEPGSSTHCLVGLGAEVERSGALIGG